MSRHVLQTKINFFSYIANYSKEYKFANDKLAIYFNKTQCYQTVHFEYVLIESFCDCHVFIRVLF